MHDIRTLIGKLNFIAQQRELGGKARRPALQTTAMFRGPVKTARATMDGMTNMMSFADDEASSWLDPEEIGTKAGGFDACDLRHWLIIAGKAGAPSVPARQILTLSEDELGAISQKIQIPDHIRKAIAKGMTKTYSAEERADLDQAASEMAATEDAIDPSRISERLHDAMDDVPHNWIVRSNLAGPSTLKAFAGAGVLEEDKTTWSPGDTNLDIGPGWVRHGNRRRVDATDARFVDTFAGGHKSDIHYLARPWITAARRVDGPDPHRHGTPFAGKGSWPCEWRVFIENGHVTGVACYYGWIGEATPENARKALEAVALAEKMIATAKALGLSSRLMELELLRDSTNRAKAAGQAVHPSRTEVLDRFPRDGLHASLDFIEGIGPDGKPEMMFLEGGPAHTPIGGGHPCAFAGNGTRPGSHACRCEGVALKLMDHVILADPKTWMPGEIRNHILSWDEARALAAQA